MSVETGLDERGRQASEALDRAAAGFVAPSPELLSAGLRRRRQRRVVALVAGSVAVAILIVPALVRSWDPLPIVDQPPLPEPTAPATTGASVPDCDSDEPGTLDGVPAGWTPLASPPHVRARSAAAWTGEQLLLVGGDTSFGGLVHKTVMAYHPATDRWTCGTDAPFELGQGAVVWAGDRLYAWGGSAAATYHPATDSWRTLPAPPLVTYEAAPVAMVWTGTELLVWGSTDRSRRATAAGTAYDPATQTWRELPAAPIVINQGEGVWTGTELIVYGARLDGNNNSSTRSSVGAAYSPATDTWRELAPFDLSPQAASIAWTGQVLIAWDYGLRAGAYDPPTDTWTTLDDLPLQPSECYPDSVVLADGSVFAWYCGQAARLGPRLRGWSRIETPLPAYAGPFPATGAPVAAGTDVYFAGAGHEGTHNALWRWQPTD